MIEAKLFSFSLPWKIELRRQTSLWNLFTLTSWETWFLSLPQRRLVQSDLFRGTATEHQNSRPGTPTSVVADFWQHFDAFGTGNARVFYYRNRDGKCHFRHFIRTKIGTETDGRVCRRTSWRIHSSNVYTLFENYPKSLIFQYLYRPNPCPVANSAKKPLAMPFPEKWPVFTNWTFPSIRMHAGSSKA